VRAGLERVFVPLRKRLGKEQLPVGLYLSSRATEELQLPEVLDAFDAELRAWGLQVVTLNAFPFGGFHGNVVKDAVFRPTWEERSRAEYTSRACQLLARWIPKGFVGSVSTHTGSHKSFGLGDDAAERIRRAWLRAATELAHIEEETGKQIILSIEPEPYARLETVDEILASFEKMWGASLRRSAAEWSVSPGWLERAARRHLGVCFDVCHQAVEFESCVTSITRLRAAGILIGKIQASIAPALARQSQGSHDQESLAKLAAFAEPRYLHQTFGRDSQGNILRHGDLGEALADPAFLAAAQEIRTHFHVPIFLERLSGSLGTTRAELESVLRQCGDATRCVEIETYTLSALPDPPRDDAAIVEIVAREWEYARDIIG
jgi:sugar phosphate isomerase/epimerase